MDYPKISLLTPTYNRSNFLPLVVHNLQNVDYEKNKIEWCVLDDGNTPLFTKGNIQKYRDLIKPIKLNYVYSTEKKTIGKKRNQLVKQASNKIVMFMDDDDIYLKSFIKHSVEVMKKEKAGLVGSNQMLFNFTNHNYRFTMLQCFSKRLIHEATMCFTKKYFKSVSGFQNSSKGEGAKMIDFNENNVAYTDIRKIMICSVHTNTINKEKFYANPRYRLRPFYFEELKIFEDILGIKYIPDLVEDDDVNADKAYEFKNDCKSIHDIMNEKKVWEHTNNIISLYKYGYKTQDYRVSHPFGKEAVQEDEEIKSQLQDIQERNPNLNISNIIQNINDKFPGAEYSSVLQQFKIQNPLLSLEQIILELNKKDCRLLV